MDSNVIDLVTGVIGFLSALLSFVAALPAITRKWLSTSGIVRLPEL